MREKLFREARLLRGHEKAIPLAIHAVKNRENCYGKNQAMIKPKKKVRTYGGPQNETLFSSLVTC